MIPASPVAATPGWRAVDGRGRDLRGGEGTTPGARSPAAALAAAPVPTWPLGVDDGTGHRLGLGEALGTGGAAVERLLAWLRRGGPGLDPGQVAARARATPAGPLPLPVEEVARDEAVRRSGGLDPGWLAEVDRRRTAPRAGLVAAGREVELEAALHVAMLVATEVLDPADDTDVDAHVASGAQLWLLAGAVVWALAGAGEQDNPFWPWAELVASGHWPVGPEGGRLVVGPGGAR